MTKEDGSILDDRIQEAFDGIAPSDEAKDRMFANILSALEEDGIGTGAAESLSEAPGSADPVVIALPVKKRHRGLVRGLSIAASFIVVALVGVALIPRIHTSKTTDANMVASEDSTAYEYETVDEDYAAGDMPLALSSEPSGSDSKSAASYVYQVPSYETAAGIDWDLVPRVGIGTKGAGTRGKAQLVWADDTGLICRIESIDVAVDGAGFCLYQATAEDLRLGVDREGNLEVRTDNGQRQVLPFSAKVTGDAFLLTLPRSELEKLGFILDGSTPLSADFLLMEDGETNYWSGSDSSGPGGYGELVF